MKKIALILLVSIYALSILGIGVRQFYCCGKLKSTDITFVQEVKAKCAMANTMAGCCKTKFKSFKVKDSHIASDHISTPVKNFTDLHIPTAAFEISPSGNVPVDVANVSHAPPLQHGIPIYILYCVFRI